MQEYMVTYQGDSAGNENGRIFYKLWFTRNDSSENFMLTPDVYVTKDELKSSNPATKEYFSRDIYTYVSSLNPNGPAEDTSQFAIREMRQGDTIFYSNGFFVLGTVTDNAAERNAFLLTDEKIAVAHLTITAKDSRHYYAKPAIILSEKGGSYLDDTVYAQNLYLRFSGVSADGTKLKIGFKESNKIIDFITLKAYVFPYINLVWIGLIIMAIGITMSLLQKLRVSYLSVVLVLLALTAALVQMFLLSN
jgi:cytochrome c-type biogenesis protein CcmF